MQILSGDITKYLYFVAVDDADFTTRETGLSSFTVYRSRNGGVAAAMTTPTINETDVTNMPGVYELLLDEDTTIDAGDDAQEMVLHITHAGMHPVTRTIDIVRPKITAGYTLGVESDGDLTKVNTLDGITLAGIADAVCDEGLGGHVTAGTLAWAISHMLNLDSGVIANAGTASEQYDSTIDGINFRALFTGLTSDGDRAGVTFSNPA